MNLQEQEKKLEEIIEQFNQLNTKFNQTIKENNLENDLTINENELPKEIAEQWTKIKENIAREAHANNQITNTIPSSKAGIGRKNAIRL